MNIQQFEDALDILKEDADWKDHLKSSALLAGSLILLTFPATTLRWNGTLDKPSLPIPREEIRKVEPGNEAIAFLFRTIRVASVIGAAGMAGYAGMLDSKIMENIPLKRKKREARSILEDEILNAKLNKMLPQEAVIEETKQPALPLALAALFGKSSNDNKDDDLEVLAAKFKNPNATGAIAPTETNDKFDKYRKTGEAIINSMVVSDKSVMISSGTGTGKTTTEREYLRRLKEKYPTIEICAFLNKGDSLPNVSEVTIFNPDLLTAIYEEDSGVSLRDALEPIFDIFDIFTERRQLSEEKRKHIKDTEPVRLILGDWFYTYQELQARLVKKDFQQILSMVRGIITVGRDSGVGLIVDTQSANLSALGLADDQSIRQSLDIYSQGFIYYEDGEVKGELETIRLVFGLNGVCSPENRKAIAEDYKFLASVIESQELRTPIIFTSVGARPRIGILPNLERVQTVNYSPIEQPKQEAVIEQEDEEDTVEEEANTVSSMYLEMTLEQMIDYFTHEDMTEEDKLWSLHAGGILHSVNTAKKFPVTCKQIYNSKVWQTLNTERPLTERIKEVCLELESAEWLAGNNSDGWVIPN